MLYRSFRQLLPAALLLMKTVTGDCTPQAGQPFTLKGEVKGRKYPAVLYLFYKDDQKVVRDSAILNDGHFVFRGTISRPLSATLSLSKQAGEQFGPPSKRLYLDPGVMILEGNGGVDSAIVEGSPSTKLADDWKKISQPYLSQLDDLRSRLYYNRGNKDSIRILKDQTDDAMTALQNALTAFVARYPDSYVSWDLVDERRVAMNPRTFQPSFEALAPKFRSSPEGKALADQIINVKQTEIGVRSPDFSQCDAHGNPISLRSLHGKYVLIDFWASWCGICRAENPNVLRAYNVYKDSGFTVLGVSLDDSRDKWLQAVKEDNMPWQQVCDMKGRNNDVAVLYGIIGIPQNVLLDPNGVIIAKNLRDRDLMNKLMEIFDGSHNMRLDGHISALKDPMVTFSYFQNDKLRTDTVAVHDGDFSWLTVMQEPERVQAMLLPSHHTFQLFSDIGYLQLTGHADSLNDLQLKGSWVADEAKMFAASTKGISDQQKDLYAKKYIRAHSQSFLSLCLLGDMLGSDRNEVYPLYMTLTEKVRNTLAGRRIAAALSDRNASLDDCTIDVNIDTVHASKVYIIWQVGEKHLIDSADIRTGKATLHENIPYPVGTRLWLDNRGFGYENGHRPDMLYFYMEKAAIHINTKDSVKKAIISGSKLNDEIAVYGKYVAGPIGQLDDLNAEIIMAPEEKRRDTAFCNPIYEQEHTTALRLKALDKEFAKENPDNYGSLLALSEAGGTNIDASVIGPLYNGLSERLRNSEAGKHLAEQIETARKTGIGAQAPDFTQNDVNDKPVKLSDFRGKYVLLDFWASWCGPCRKENPNYVKAYHTYKDRNFTLLSVSLDRPGEKDKWLAAIKADGLEWAQVSDLKYWYNDVAKLYDIRAVPQNFLIGPDGKIIARNLRGEELLKKLNELIKL